MLRGLGVVVAVAAVLVGVLWLFQRQLVFLPDRSSPPTPADATAVTVTTDDGLDLDAWFLAPDEPPVATVLVLNGNAGNRGHRLPLARGLVERGHAVLLLDYRGYGGNPGRPSEAGLIADARAAHAHLAARADVDPATIVHLGESIGSGVAAGVAVDDPPAALVLRSPFPRLSDVAREHYGSLGALVRDTFETSARLGAVDAPVLVVAGDADRIVPAELSREVARDADTELLVVEGADHNDAVFLDGGEFLDEVDRFVRAALDDRA